MLKYGNNGIFGTNVNTNLTVCNNCGKPGHAFYQCKHPITSVGIVVFRPVNDSTTSRDKYEYLMIRRRFSIGYMEFIRGKYPLYNKQYLLNIISEMTDLERANVATQDFDELWQQLWGDHVGIQYRNEENHSRDKFEALKAGIKCSVPGGSSGSSGGGYSEYSRQSLVEECNAVKRWTEPEWGFPKGRHDRKENDLLCALREFEEETGYNRTALHLVHNLLPLEEIFTGSNFKSYKHKYYVATLDAAAEPLPAHSSSEVGEMLWMPFSKALAAIRDYNLEKRELLSRVNNILTRYKLVTTNTNLNANTFTY